MYNTINFARKILRILCQMAASAIVSIEKSYFLI